MGKMDQIDKAQELDSVLNVQRCEITKGEEGGETEGGSESLRERDKAVIF